MAAIAFICRLLRSHESGRSCVIGNSRSAVTAQDCRIAPYSTYVYLVVGQNEWKTVCYL